MCGRRSYGLILVAAAGVVACKGSVAVVLPDGATVLPDGRVVTPDAGDNDGGDATDGGAVTADGGGGTADGGGGTTDGGPRDSGPRPFDAGPCASGGLASWLTTRPISGVSATGRVFAAPTTTGGAVVAWDGGGRITLQQVGAGGSTEGSAVSVDGNGLWGLDVRLAQWGVLVSRGTDALYLVVVGSDGGPVFEQRLLGEVPHDVTNNEWFGTGIRYARLLWDGSRWAAYYTVNRLWPDGIAHYGDQLTFWSPDGSSDGIAWSWGCSHSMEVRIEHNGTILGPVCASDCFPAKGVHFNHRSAMLYPDETGSNCGGRYGTSLGGVVPMTDGFWVSFAAIDSRSSSDVAIARVHNDRTADMPIWLTDDSATDGDVHAERYGGGLVVGWTSSGTNRMARLSEAGRILEGPVDLPAADLPNATDFFRYSDGDVGWVIPGATTRLARLRACP